MRDKTHRADRAAKTQAVVRMERRYPHSPERVWGALTDPRALSQWLLPTDFQPREGHRFRFTRPSERRDPNGRGKIERIDCRVLEVDAPHRLTYLWQAEEDSFPTLITWTLEPIETGTLLRIEHIGPQANLLCKASMQSSMFESSMFDSSMFDSSMFDSSMFDSSMFESERNLMPNMADGAFMVRRMGRILLSGEFSYHRADDHRPLRCVGRQNRRNAICRSCTPT